MTYPILPDSINGLSLLVQVVLLDLSSLLPGSRQLAFSYRLGAWRSQPPMLNNVAVRSWVASCNSTVSESSLRMLEGYSSVPDMDFGVGAEISSAGWVLAFRIGLEGGKTSIF